MKFTALLLAALPALTSAADLLFYPNNHCGGTALKCSNIQANICCSAGASHTWSAKIQNVKPNFEHVVWSKTHCSGNSARFANKLNACIQGNSWPIWSSHWINKNKKRSYPISDVVAAPATAEDCVDADTVEFESGKQVKIQRGMLGEAAELAKRGLGEGDVAWMAVIEQ